MQRCSKMHCPFLSNQYYRRRTQWGGIFWKKLVHNCNKRGVEGGNVHGGWIFFFKISKRDFAFIREMRVQKLINARINSEKLIPIILPRF